MFGIASIIIAAFCVVLLFFGFWWYSSKIQRYRKMAHEVSSISARHAELEKRANMVEASAVSYVNSLGKEGVTILKELQDRLAQTSYLVKELESLLVSGERTAIVEIEMFLCNNHPRQFSPEDNFDGTTRFLRYNPNWDQEIEGLLQQLGGSVSQASIAATSIGIPKKRERKSTLINLLDAGIDLISLREGLSSETKEDE